MAAKQVADSLPPLPAASIDYDALQSALRSGKSGGEAIAAAAETPPVRNTLDTLRDGTKVLVALIGEKDGSFTIEGADLDKPESLKSEDAARKRFRALVKASAVDPAPVTPPLAQPDGGAAAATE